MNGINCVVQFGNFLNRPNLDYPNADTVQAFRYRNPVTRFFEIDPGATATNSVAELKNMGFVGIAVFKEDLRGHSDSFVNDGWAKAPSRQHMKDLVLS